MSRFVSLFLLVLVPIFAGCNAYHPLQGGVGFTDVPLGNDGYLVTYVGDESIAECRQFAMTRASELAVMRDQPFFQVVNERIYVSYGTHYWPGSAYYGGGGRHGYYVYDPGYVESYSIPEVNLTIHLCRPNDPNAIPAAYILRQSIQNGVKLSPGIEDRLATLPPPPPQFTLPPPPPPTTRPAP